MQNILKINYFIKLIDVFYTFFIDISENVSFYQFF
jgi:hypothetical protein